MRSLRSLQLTAANDNQPLCLLQLVAELLHCLLTARLALPHDLVMGESFLDCLRRGVEVDVLRRLGIHGRLPLLLGVFILNGARQVVVTALLEHRNARRDVRRDWLRQSRLRWWRRWRRGERRGRW